MTNLKDQFTTFVLTTGKDEEGTEVVFELECGCMVAVDGEDKELILCDAHDDECLDNEGQTFEALLGKDLLVAVLNTTVDDAHEEDELPEIFMQEELVFPEAPVTQESSEVLTLDDLVEEETTQEKDDEIMTITMKNTVAQMKAYATDNNIDIKGLTKKADIFARIMGTETTEPVVTLEDMVDDAPMVDDLEQQYYELQEAPPEMEEEQAPVEEQPADAVALAQELLDLINKGTNFSTLMQKVKENATAIVNGGVVKSEPKKTQEQSKPEPVKETAKEQGASAASDFTKFKTAAILESTNHSVTFEADGEKYIFLKNTAGKTLIRKVGSNTNSYMKGQFLQSLIYDINTQASRALFRKVKAIINVDAPTQTTNKVDGAASEASAKEKNSAAKNNSAEVMSVLGTEIPKAWFNQYVKDEAMTKKHGRLKLNAQTIIAEFTAQV